MFYTTLSCNMDIDQNKSDLYVTFNSYLVVFSAQNF